MAKDRFKHRNDQVSDPARNFQNIATSDGADLVTEPKGVVFATTGVAQLVGDDGNQAAVPVIAGVLYPYVPVRALTTGHTAGQMTIVY